MVVEVVSNRQVDPRVWCNHGGAVGRVLDDVQLIGRANATYHGELATLVPSHQARFGTVDYFGTAAWQTRMRQRPE